MRLKRPLSHEWTAEDRLRVIAALLPDIQHTITAGCYGAPGTITILTLQHIIVEPREVLEPHRAEFETAVAQWETAYPGAA